MSKDFRTALEAYTGAEALRAGGVPHQVRAYVLAVRLLSGDK